MRFSASMIRGGRKPSRRNRILLLVAFVLIGVVFWTQARFLRSSKPPRERPNGEEGRRSQWTSELVGEEPEHTFQQPPEEEAQRLSRSPRLSVLRVYGTPCPTTFPSSLSEGLKQKANRRGGLTSAGPTVQNVLDNRNSPVLDFWSAWLRHSTGFGIADWETNEVISKHVPPSSEGNGGLIDAVITFINPRHHNFSQSYRAPNPSKAVGAERLEGTDSGDAAHNRVRDWNELYWSLKSLFLYGQLCIGEEGEGQPVSTARPTCLLRNIVLVVALGHRELPSWLQCILKDPMISNTNSGRSRRDGADAGFEDFLRRKIRVVTHAEIFQYDGGSKPQDEGPVSYNSNFIELNLKNIPGLSPLFVSFNNDMFLGRRLHLLDLFVPFYVPRNGPTVLTGPRSQADEKHETPYCDFHPVTYWEHYQPVSVVVGVLRKAHGSNAKTESLKESEKFLDFSTFNAKLLEENLTVFYPHLQSAFEAQRPRRKSGSKPTRIPVGENSPFKAYSYAHTPTVFDVPFLHDIIRMYPPLQTLSKRMIQRHLATQASTPGTLVEGGIIQSSGAASSRQYDDLWIPLLHGHLRTWTLRESSLSPSASPATKAIPRHVKLLAAPNVRVLHAEARDVVPNLDGRKEKLQANKNASSVEHSSVVECDSPSEAAKRPSSQRLRIYQFHMVQSEHFLLSEHFKLKQRLKKLQRIGEFLSSYSFTSSRHKQQCDRAGIVSSFPSPFLFNTLNDDLPTLLDTGLGPEGIPVVTPVWPDVEEVLFRPPPMVEPPLGQTDFLFPHRKCHFNLLSCDETVLQRVRQGLHQYGTIQRQGTNLTFTGGSQPPVAGLRYNATALGSRLLLGYHQVHCTNFILAQEWSALVRGNGPYHSP